MALSTKIKVYFGRHLIATYSADQDRADRYVEAVRRRFAGLRVELEPAHRTAGVTAELPEEWQWIRPPT